MRLLAPNSLLYTEMLTSGAILHNPARTLDFNEMEHPIAMQLGGSDKHALAKAASSAEQAGYDEINLNLGCPSDKVQAGHFGACLMNEPQRVVKCIEAIRQAVSIPVTAKTRIGIDNQDSYEFFSDFARRLIDAGCQKLVVHARKAWLNGLSPKQNRTIPPVQYDYVYRFKKEFPHIPIVINGNIVSEEQINEHLNQVDGVMLGRLACDNPYKIAMIHQHLYPEVPILSRNELVSQYVPYVLEQQAKGVSLSLLIKPLFNLSFGLPGASQWKKQLMAVLQTKDVSALLPASSSLG
jgi:tRNA-dihydrouridine synthase A